MTKKRKSTQEKALESLTSVYNIEEEAAAPKEEEVQADDLTTPTEEQDHDHGTQDEEGGIEDNVSVGEDHQEREQQRVENAEGQVDEDVTESTAPEVPGSEPRIPPARLAKEADRRREAETLNADLKRQLEEVNNRLKNIEATNTEVEPEEDFELDFYADPKTAINKMLDSRLSGVSKQVDNMSNQQQNAAAVTQVSNIMAQSAQRFAESTPNYGAAVNHLIDVDRKIVAMSGTPDNQIDSLVEQRVFAAVTKAIQSGKDPAQYIYEASQAMGFTPVTDTAPPQVNSGKLTPSQLEQKVRANRDISGGGASTRDVPDDSLLKLSPLQAANNLAAIDKTLASIKAK